MTVLLSRMPREWRTRSITMSHPARHRSDPQLLRVDRRKLTPPFQQRGRRHTTTGNRSQFGDGVPVHRDGRRFDVGDALKHATTVRISGDVSS